jgi:hypothetical protein
MRQVTDNCDLEGWPVCNALTYSCIVLTCSENQQQKRYDELAHVVHCYRHLKQLIWAGRGHDPKGVDETQAAELALPCPACPHPGKNLPPGYETAPLWKRYVRKLLG